MTTAPVAPAPNDQTVELDVLGMTCAACVWLNEQHVGKLPGVTAVDINYATRRVRVRWDEARIRLSDILAAWMNPRLRTQYGDQ
mgnify:CR=1 FL=1